MMTIKVMSSYRRSSQLRFAVTRSPPTQLRALSTAELLNAMTLRPGPESDRNFVPDSIWLWQNESRLAHSVPIFLELLQELAPQFPRQPAILETLNPTQATALRDRVLVLMQVSCVSRDVQEFPSQETVDSRPRPLTSAEAQKVFAVFQEMLSGYVNARQRTLGERTGALEACHRHLRAIWALLSGRGAR